MPHSSEDSSSCWKGIGLCRLPALSTYVQYLLRKDIADDGRKEGANSRPGVRCCRVKCGNAWPRVTAAPFHSTCSTHTAPPSLAGQHRARCLPSLAYSSLRLLSVHFLMNIAYVLPADRYRTQSTTMTPRIPTGHFARRRRAPYSRRLATRAWGPTRLAVTRIIWA